MTATTKTKAIGFVIRWGDDDGNEEFMYLDESEGTPEGGLLKGSMLDEEIRPTVFKSMSEAKRQIRRMGAMMQLFGTDRIGSGCVHPSRCTIHEIH